MTLSFLPACRAMFGYTPRWSRIFLKMFSFFCRCCWKWRISKLFCYCKEILYFSDLSIKDDIFFEHASILTLRNSMGTIKNLWKQMCKSIACISLLQYVSFLSASINLHLNVFESTLFVSIQFETNMCWAVQLARHIGIH